MPTNQFKTFAAAGGANVLSQAEYDMLAAQSTGFETGIADSAAFNKVWRQSAFMTAALAESMMRSVKADVLDDGDLEDKVGKLLTMFPSTGDIKYTAKVAADAGWVLLNDGSIGSAGSAATTRANADTVDLFTLLWNNYTNANCPVSGGRGANAAADYAANKTLTLPLFRGRVLGVSGAGAGLTARTAGTAVGEETHLLTVAELPAHGHVVPSGDEAGGAGQAEGTNLHNLADINSENTGDDDPHNNMQPTVFMQAMIKL